MQNVLKMGLLAVVASSLVGCATTGGAGGGGGGGGGPKVVVKPSELGAAYASLDTVAAMQTDDHRIEFEGTGKKAYDGFIKDVALVVAPVLITDAVLELIESAGQDIAGQPHGPVADYDALAKAVAEKSGSLSKEQIAGIRDQLERLDALVETLKKTPEQAKAMGDSGQKLVQQATNDLMKDPFGMAAVPVVLGGALAKVTATAGTKLPSVTGRAANVFKFLAQCRCTNDRAALTPGEISPQLGSLFDAKSFDADGTRVDYAVTGMADFDGIFKDVAVVRGSVTLLNVWVKEVGATIASVTGVAGDVNLADLPKLISGLDKKKVKTVTDVPAKLKKHMDQAQAIVAAMANIPKVAQELGGKLTQIGPKALEAATTSPARMAGLPSAVETTVNDLKTTVEQSAAALKDQQALIAPLKGLAG